MISEDRVKGSLGIGVGMLMAVGMSFLASRVSQGVLWALWVPSTAVFVTGCAFYSKSKGYSPYLGVLGFGWIFGLIALIFLKDRNDNTLKEVQAAFEARRKARSKQPLP